MHCRSTLLRGWYTRLEQTTVSMKLCPPPPSHHTLCTRSKTESHCRKPSPASARRRPAFRRPAQPAGRPTPPLRSPRKHVDGWMGRWIMDHYLLTAPPGQESGSACYTLCLHRARHTSLYDGAQAPLAKPGRGTSATARSAAGGPAAGCRPLCRTTQRGGGAEDGSAAGHMARGRRRAEPDAPMPRQANASGTRQYLIPQYLSHWGQSGYLPGISPEAIYTYAQRAHTPLEPAAAA